MNNVNFYGYSVSKLILWDNPISGHSYIQDRITSTEMKQYHISPIIKAAFILQSFTESRHKALKDGQLSMVLSRKTAVGLFVL